MSLEQLNAYCVSKLEALRNKGVLKGSEKVIARIVATLFPYTTLFRSDRKSVV